MSLPGLFLSFSKINGFTGSRPEGQAVSAPRLWLLGYMPLHTRIVTPPGVHLSADPAPTSAPWGVYPSTPDILCTLFPWLPDAPGFLPAPDRLACNLRCKFA